MCLTGGDMRTAIGAVMEGGGKIGLARWLSFLGKDVTLTPRVARVGANAGEENPMCA
jgi:hypothetical protein